MENVRIAKTFLKKMKEPVLISPVIIKLQSSG